jgi:hypothetical protein
MRNLNFLGRGKFLVAKEFLQFVFRRNPERPGVVSPKDLKELPVPPDSNVVVFSSQSVRSYI